MLIAGLSNHRINPSIPLKIERLVRERVGNDQILNPYSLMFSKLDKQVLIDSSKYVDWVSKKLQAKEFHFGTNRRLFNSFNSRWSRGSKLLSTMG